MTASGTDLALSAMTVKALTFAGVATAMNISERRAASIVLGKEVPTGGELAGLVTALGLPQGALDSLVPKPKRKEPPWWLPALWDKGLLAVVATGAIAVLNSCLAQQRTDAQNQYDLQLAFFQAQVTATSSVSGLMVSETGKMLSDYRDLIALTEALKQAAAPAAGDQVLADLAKLHASIVASLEVLDALIEDEFDIAEAAAAVERLATTAAGGQGNALGIEELQNVTTTALLALPSRAMTAIRAELTREREAARAATTPN